MKLDGGAQRTCCGTWNSHAGCSGFSLRCEDASFCSFVVSFIVRRYCHWHLCLVLLTCRYPITTNHHQPLLSWDLCEEVDDYSVLLMKLKEYDQKMCISLLQTHCLCRYCFKQLQWSLLSLQSTPCVHFHYLVYFSTCL
jgi:hypothetical protein